MFLQNQAWPSKPAGLESNGPMVINDGIFYISPTLSTNKVRQQNIPLQLLQKTAQKSWCWTVEYKEWSSFDWLNSGDVSAGLDNIHRCSRIRYYLLELNINYVINHSFMLCFVQRTPASLWDFFLIWTNGLRTEEALWGKVVILAYIIKMNLTWTSGFVIVQLWKLLKYGLVCRKVYWLPCPPCSGSDSAVSV